MKQKAIICKDSLDLLQNNKFTHKDQIFVPSLSGTIECQALTVNNLKTIAKMFITETPNLEETLLHYITGNSIELNKLNKMDKCAIFGQVVLINLLDPMEIIKDCYHCQVELKKNFDSSVAEFNKWESPSKLVNTDLNGVPIEIELGLPSIIDLQHNPDITIFNEPLAYVKNLKCDNELITDLSMETKQDIFKFFNFDIISYKIYEEMDKIEKNIEFKIPHRCHNCGEMNFFVQKLFYFIFSTNNRR
jgi:hypothetical protein